MVLVSSLCAGAPGSVGHASAKKALNIAHRGYWEDGVYEENTPKAINKAYSLGFKAIEVDIFACKDGTIRVFHDPKTDKICGYPGYIWDHPELLIKKGQTKIPTLTKICSVIKKNGNGAFFIHLKTYPNYGYTITNKMLKKVLKILDKAGMKHVALMCNDQNVHKRLYNIICTKYGTRDACRYKTFLILGKSSDLNQSIQFCKTYGLSTIVSKSTWTYVDVSKIHAAGLKSGMYGIKNKKMYKKRRKQVEYLFLDGLKVIR